MCPNNCAVHSKDFVCPVVCPVIYLSVLLCVCRWPIYTMLFILSWRLVLFMCPVVSPVCISYCVRVLFICPVVLSCCVFVCPVVYPGGVYSIVYLASEKPQTCCCQQVDLSLTCLDKQCSLIWLMPSLPCSLCVWYSTHNLFAISLPHSTIVCCFYLGLTI